MAYDPKSIEPGIRERWERSGYFNPDKLPGRRRKTFSIAMPPSNVTGDLHIGHALTIALEDLMTRYHRMRGEAALWVPGTDHAGIATQIMVERMLAEQGISRHDIGREQFLQHVWAWKDRHGSRIVEQIKSMGASCDWSREHFTMDRDLTAAVQEAFVRLFNDGLVYRAERLINWCPNDQTALSDLEVSHTERTGELWHLRYPVISTSHAIVVATTRPETMLGDTAVAVHPSDERYRSLVGRKVKLPLVGREIPIVADRRVDPAFGTGAVKVTPAHDFTDAEIAKANDLPAITVIGPDGRMTREAGADFEGLPIHEARVLVVEALQHGGFMEREEDYRHAVAVCGRCGTTIEPRLSQQWFVKMQPLVKQAIAAVRSRKIRSLPERFEKQYFHWLENIEDWCISRQLWWGHQIPVWYRAPKHQRQWELKLYGEEIFQALADGTKRIEVRAGRRRREGKYWGDFKRGDRILFRLADERTDAIVPGKPPRTLYVAGVRRFPSLRHLLRVYQSTDDHPGKSARELEAWWKHRPALWKRVRKYGVWAIELARAEPREIRVGRKPPSGTDWSQDDDVLDTWFSSALWTFSTLGWPRNKTRLRKKGDLARFHPTSVMETGWDILFFWVARMVILSLYLVGEIPFRVVYLNGLILDKQGKKMSRSKGTGVDPAVMTEKYGTDALRLSLVIGQSAGQDFRMYEEKISGQRNVVNKLWNIGQYVQTVRPTSTTYKLQATRLSDRWILSRLANVTREVTDAIEGYDFSTAGQQLIDFTWHEFADWYVEIHKVERNDAILRHVFNKLLILLHPFAPFITEELWQDARTAKGGRTDLLLIHAWPKPGKRDLKAERTFAELQRTVVALRNFRKYSGLTAEDAGTLRSNDSSIPAPMFEKLAGVALSGRGRGETVVLGSLTVEFPAARVAAFQAWGERRRAELTEYVKQLETKLDNPKLPDEIRRQDEVKLADARRDLGG